MLCSKKEQREALRENHLGRVVEEAAVRYHRGGHSVAGRCGPHHGIAMWFGHENIKTTHINVIADLGNEEKRPWDAAAAKWRRLPAQARLRPLVFQKPFESCPEYTDMLAVHLPCRPTKGKRFLRCKAFPLRIR
jgi:homospermidine synthase